MADSHGCQSLSVKDDREEVKLPHPPGNDENIRPGKSALTHNYLFSVLDRTQKDVESSDLLCSLFVSALTNYRRDTVLRPFPPTYIDNGVPTEAGQKNFEILKCAMQEIPPLPFIVQQNQIDNWTGIMSKECADLLLWILDTKGFTIRTENKQLFSQIKEMTGQMGEAASPSHIFEVVYSPEVENKFQTERGDRDCIYAYHGSRVENFHSILHNGLCSHMNKNSLFGEGTYLSSELSVCMPYSPTGQGWSRSILGPKMSCVAVCEIISHSGIKCHTRDVKNQTGAYQALNDNLSGNNVPEKYYIVQNNEHLRIKYLLVFVDTNSSKVKGEFPRKFRGIGWITGHKLISLMILYLMFLVAIGLSDSRPLRMFFRKHIW